MAVKKIEEKHKPVTDFTDVIGGNGPWQRTIFLMIFFSGFPCAWNTLIMSFLAPNIDHWCAKPSKYSNISDEDWKLHGIPSDSNSEDRHCKMYQFVNSSQGNVSSIPSNMNNLVDCDRWEYDDSMFKSTVISQWNLVCDQAWTISMTNSVMMIGSLISAIVIGQFSDRFGRKPALMATVLILVIGGIGSALSTSYIPFAISRFFAALGSGGLFVTGFIILMEVVGRDYRSLYGLSMEFGWCTGYVLLPLVAWLIRDAFWIQVVVVIPGLGLLLMWWFVPESPRWLLTQNKFKKAEVILSKAAKKNRRDLNEVNPALEKLYKSVDSTDESEDNKGRGYIIDLFTTPGLWQKTLNLIFNWMVISFVYYGLSFNTNDLVGDPFINFAIAGAVEFPAYLISVFVIQSLGRRFPLMATMVFGGLACLITIFLTGDLAWVSMPLAMIGKFCITAAFGIVYVYTAELFPTVVRNTGVGTCAMCGRAASVLAPFVKELGHATHPAVPLACFGGFSIISGLLILILPETNRCTVPDTLQEAADFGRKKLISRTSGEQITRLVDYETGSEVSKSTTSDRCVTMHDNNDDGDDISKKF